MHQNLNSGKLEKLIIICTLNLWLISIKCWY